MSNGLEMKYFVLNPNKRNAYGAASRMALRTYAEEIDSTNTKLSQDIETWVFGISEDIAGEEEADG